MKLLLLFSVLSFSCVFYGNTVGDSDLQSGYGTIIFDREIFLSTIVYDEKIVDRKGLLILSKNGLKILPGNYIFYCAYGFSSRKVKIAVTVEAGKTYKLFFKDKIKQDELDFVETHG